MSALPSPSFNENKRVFPRHNHHHQHHHHHHHHHCHHCHRRRGYSTVTTIADSRSHAAAFLFRPARQWGGGQGPGPGQQRGNPPRAQERGSGSTSICHKPQDGGVSAELATRGSQQTPERCRHICWRQALFIDSYVVRPFLFFFVFRFFALLFFFLFFCRSNHVQGTRRMPFGWLKSITEPDITIGRCRFLPGTN